MVGTGSILGIFGVAATNSSQQLIQTFSAHPNGCSNIFTKQTSINLSMGTTEMYLSQLKCEAEDYENVLRRIGHATQYNKTFNCGGSSSYNIKMKG